MNKEKAGIVSGANDHLDTKITGTLQFEFLFLLGLFFFFNQPDLPTSSQS